MQAVKNKSRCPFIATQQGHWDMSEAKKTGGEKKVCGGRL